MWIQFYSIHLHFISINTTRTSTPSNNILTYAWTMDIKSLSGSTIIQSQESHSLWIDRARITERRIYSTNSFWRNCNVLNTAFCSLNESLRIMEFQKQSLLSVMTERNSSKVQLCNQQSPTEYFTCHLQITTHIPSSHPDENLEVQQEVFLQH